MQNTPASGWIRAGFFALPIYGVLTAWATVGAQPDAAVDPEGWARYVSTTSYLAGHVLGSTGGTIFAIFGSFALGGFLARSRAARLALAAMVVAVLGQALLLAAGAVSTFALPAMGQAYLAGAEVVVTLEWPTAMSIMMLAGMLLVFVGNVLLGVAVWRSGALPRGAGALWVAAFVVFILLGAALGMLTTGASLPTQPIGAALMAISGAWMASAALRESATSTVVTSQQPHAV
ncbi:MAG TPA: hypothetical protein VFP89_04575 [Propionibacteriaceae bacterium]|nr:hypothetical protein [Propionibacteriaceae bacterium]